MKAATAGALAARREELAVALDDAALLTEAEAIAAFGPERGECRRGSDRGVIPGPDRGPVWSCAAEVLAARAEKLREGLRPPPCVIADRRRRVRHRSADASKVSFFESPETLTWPAATDRASGSPSPPETTSLP